MNLGKHIKSAHVTHPDEELHRELAEPSIVDREKTLERLKQDDERVVRHMLLNSYITPTQPSASFTDTSA